MLDCLKGEYIMLKVSFFICFTMLSILWVTGYRIYFSFLLYFTVGHKMYPFIFAINLSNCLRTRANSILHERLQWILLLMCVCACFACGSVKQHSARLINCFPWFYILLIWHIIHTCHFDCCQDGGEVCEFCEAILDDVRRLIADNRTKVQPRWFWWYFNIWQLKLIVLCAVIESMPPLCGKTRERLWLTDWLTFEHCCW